MSKGEHEGASRNGAGSSTTTRSWQKYDRSSLPRSKAALDAYIWDSKPDPVKDRIVAPYGEEDGRMMVRMSEDGSYEPDPDTTRDMAERFLQEKEADRKRGAGTMGGWEEAIFAAQTLGRKPVTRSIAEQRLVRERQRTAEAILLMADIGSIRLTKAQREALETSRAGGYRSLIEAKENQVADQKKPGKFKFRPWAEEKIERLREANTRGKSTRVA